MKFSKAPKNRHFPKGLVHGFCPKVELFLIDVFHRNHMRNDRFKYGGKKIMLTRGKK